VLRRCWDRHRTTFGPVHDLGLGLGERHPGALDDARPLTGWALPECFTRFRSRLEADDPSQSSVGSVRVLRLVESFALDELAAAAQESLAIERCSPDLEGVGEIGTKPYRLPRAGRLLDRPAAPGQDDPEIILIGRAGWLEPYRLPVSRDRRFVPSLASRDHAERVQPFRGTTINVLIRYGPR